MATITVRRLAAVAAIVGATALTAVPATAATPGAWMPAGNPGDYAGLAATDTAKRYQVRISPTMLANPGTVAFGDPETTGGGRIVIGKRVNSGMTGYQTITVQPLDAGLTLASAMATQAGGNLGTTQIASTSMTSKRFVVKLRYPGSEGQLSNVYLRFTTFQLLL